MIDLIDKVVNKLRVLRRVENVGKQPALLELEMLMGVAQDNSGVLETLAALYAKGYCLKLRIMPKESNHVDR